MGLRWRLAAALVAGVPALLSAYRADAATTDPEIRAMERQIQALSEQVRDLKRASNERNGPLQPSSGARTGLANGRLSITSDDGEFSIALRALVQFDTAYYMQSASAASLPAGYGPDLSSGGNFRRVYLGIQGKVFGDWSYNVNFDFGGSGGTEQSGRIQSAYLQFDALAPWGFRVGAFPPPANIEDGTGSGDTIFLERNAPSDLQRSLAGGDGRDAISILYMGDHLFGALSYTGGKVQDSAAFDEQHAVVGRVSYLFDAGRDAHILIGVNGTHVFKLPDLTAHGSIALGSPPSATALHTVTLSDPPELTVDSGGTKLASTGALAADHVSQWGAEMAGNYGNLYAQAGYYAFLVDRAAIAYRTYASATDYATTIVQPDDDAFQGWYMQATWVLTGESRPYNPATGAFGAPKPAERFSPAKGRWGAWEIAARYSDLNLNDHAFDSSSVITNWTGAATRTYTFYNTVRGGDQRIATVGLNWYPNSAVRFALDYQWIDVSRLQSPAAVTSAGTPQLPTLNGGQTAQAVSFRAQLAL